MIALTQKKQDSNVLFIPKPKERGYMPPSTKVFKNRRHEFKNKWHKN